MKLKTFLIMSIAILAGQHSLANTADDTFKTHSGKEVKIHCIKHGSLMIEYNNQYIQIDPVTNQPPKTDYSTYPKADFILVTHEHADHLDPQAIETLSKPETQIILNKNSEEKLGKGTVMKNGDELTLANGIKIEAVPAYNTTKEHLQFHPKGRDNGYILNIDGLRIYIAGDTEDIPEMDQIKNIDVAFLPCNQPYTMTPEQLAKAARMITPKVLYPYHYGNTPMKQVQQLLKGTKIDVRIRNMQ
ncbi:MAG: MBL fold metallo-hydrolase [Bacteroides sp.]|nr:MBL fold metallo-hydrolase [Bacteroides sp.]